MPPTSNRGNKSQLKNNPRPSTYTPSWGGLSSTTSGSAGGYKPKPKPKPPTSPAWMPGLNTPGTPTLGGGMPTNLKPPKNPLGGVGNQPYGPAPVPTGVNAALSNWTQQMFTPVTATGDDGQYDSIADWWQSVTQPAQINPRPPKRNQRPAGPSLNQTMGVPQTQNPFVTNTPQMANLRENIDERLGFEEQWKPGWAQGDNPTPPGIGGYPGHTGVPLRDYYYYLKSVMQPGGADQATGSGFGSTYKGWGGSGGYGGGGYGGNGYVNPAYLNLFSWNYGE